MNGSDGRIDFTTLSMVATLLSFTSVQFDRTASAVNPFVVVSRLSLAEKNETQTRVCEFSKMFGQFRPAGANSYPLQKAINGRRSSCILSPNTSGCSASQNTHHNILGAMTTDHLERRRPSSPTFYPSSPSRQQQTNTPTESLENCCERELLLERLDRSFI